MKSSVVWSSDAFKDCKIKSPASKTSSMAENESSNAGKDSKSKIKWTAEEVACISSNIQSFFKRHVVPNKEAYEECISNSKMVLDKRPRCDVKNKVKNMIVALRKKSTNSV